MQNTENNDKILDFIGIYDTAINQDLCQKIIEYFEKLRSYNLTFTRQKSQDGKKHEKDDETAFVLENYILQNYENPIFHDLIEIFWKKYESYVDNFSLLEESGNHGMTSMRLQKTLPGQGFHNWHFESYNLSVANRLISWTVFLNDVDYGGEMEFLYYNKRITARQGRLVIWPAGFTHVHRGNPPLSGEKYILTGWLEFWS
jgi:hypothetical protein